MVKSGNYLRLANVISANWIQRRSISNGSHLKQVLMPKRKEIVTYCEQPQTINIPVFGNTSRRYVTTVPAPSQRAATVSLKYLPCATTMFYNEVDVVESHANTSFWACCIGSMYFGIEEFGGNEKLATFAIVKSTRSDQKTSDDDDLKELEENLQLQDRKAKSGTNVYTSIRFPWNAGDPISLVLAFIPESDIKSTYVANIYNNNSKKWENVGKFSFRQGIPVSQKHPCRSIIMDSKAGAAKEARSASFNPWILDDKRTWIQPNQAVFDHTGTSGKVNAWHHSGRFFMRTGGDTEQKIIRGQALKRHVSKQVPSIVKQISDELESKQKK